MERYKKNKELFWWIICVLIIMLWNAYLYNQPPKELDVYDIMRYEQMIL